MTFAYSLTYGNNNREKQITGNSYNDFCNADLTPKWKAGIQLDILFKMVSRLHNCALNVIFKLENGL
jgi:hypothetical protein